VQYAEEEEKRRREKEKRNMTMTMMMITMIMKMISWEQYYHKLYSFLADGNNEEGSVPTLTAGCTLSRSELSAWI
jgi:uncharacterized membrane protein